MKFFAVFAAVLALAAGSPYSWSLQELSEALQNPHTNPEYIPYLEHALNQMMEDLHAGKPVAPVAVIMPTASQWTLEELSNALQSPATDPAIVPYLEDALNAMMDALFNGQQIETMPVVIPVELAPVQAGADIITAPVIATPVLPTPVLPAPVLPEMPVPEVPAPEVPAPEVPDPEGSLLPESPEPSPEVVIPGPIILPMPVLPEVQPEPEAVNPGPIVLPMPVLPEVQPEPEVVVPGPIVNPMPVLPVVQPEQVEEQTPQNPNGEIFNDGNVQVIVNGPEQPGVLSSIQSWFQMFLNYFSNGVQTSQQIF
ncbi:PREDICTED: calphotin-like [Papilio xuthus]|uniref:Calphotin-like n=1 Tax=Papilio xuthus TaxID=66420 RepID=A0AAJ7E590_PAPXU|nr:PREDICTED: calphotin-like [Papilio xuthus]